MNIQPQYAYDTETGRMIHRDQGVESFRGEQWFFKGVSRPAEGDSSGRVAVARTCPDAYTTSNGMQECPHSWHRNGIETAEYFPGVFGLVLHTEEVHAEPVNRGSW